MIQSWANPFNYIGITSWDKGILNLALKCSIFSTLLIANPTEEFFSFIWLSLCWPWLPLEAPSPWPPQYNLYFLSYSTTSALGFSKNWNSSGHLVVFPFSSCFSYPQGTEIRPTSIILSKFSSPRWAALLPCCFLTWLPCFTSPLLMAEQQT